MLPNHSTTACWHGKAVVRGTTGVRPALLDCLRHRWCCHAGRVRLPTAEGVPRAGGGAPGRKECFPALGATGAGCTGCGATARVDEGAQRAPHPNGLSVWGGGGGLPATDLAGATAASAAPAACSHQTDVRTTLYTSFWHSRGEYFHPKGREFHMYWVSPTHTLRAPTHFLGSQILQKQLDKSSFAR